MMKRRMILSVLKISIDWPCNATYFTVQESNRPVTGECLDVLETKLHVS